MSSICRMWNYDPSASTITSSTTIIVPLELRTSELIIPAASGVAGASILGDWIAKIANLEGLVCGDE